MPKRAATEIKGAIETDERFAAENRQVPEVDPIVTVSLSLPESYVQSLERYVIQKKHAGNRGFSRSKVVKDLLGKFLKDNNLL